MKRLCMALTLWCACAMATTLHVGTGQTYAAIQTAWNASVAGDTILVHAAGSPYAGFKASGHSGTSGSPITIQAENSSVTISSPEADGDGIRIDSVNYVTVDGFTVAGSIGYGVFAVQGTGIVIKNCIVHGMTFSGILTGFARHVQVLNNTTYSNGTLQGHHGIYISNSDVGDDAPVVRGNVSYSNAGAGIQFNGDCETLDSNGATDGVISGAIVEGNILHDNGGSGLSLIDISDSVFRNNVLYGTTVGAGAIKLAMQGTCGGGSNRNLFVNNTVNGNTFSAVRIVTGVGNVFFNNLTVSDRGDLTCVIDADVSACNDGNGGNYWSPGQLFYSQAAAATGIFTSYATNDYTLTNGSPAIGSGLSSFRSLSGPKIDFLNNARPFNSTYDQGAYEYGASSAGSDTTAPTPPSSISSTATAAQVALTYSGASDNRELLGYYILRNGTPIGVSLTGSYTDTAVVPGTTYTYTVESFDGLPNVSTASSGAQVTVPGIVGCLNADATWRYRLQPYESGTFTWEADLTPFSVPNNGTAGLSLAPPTDYSNLGVIVAFNGPGNTMQVRNGSTYAADTSITYVSGTLYHVRMVINVAAHTYSVYVTPAGGSEQTLAAAYAFRSELGTAAGLTYMAAFDDTGSVAVCNPTINGTLLDDMTYVEVAPGTTGISQTAQGNGSGNPVLDSPDLIVLTTDTTLTLAHKGKLLYYAGSSPITVTVPSGLGAKYGTTLIQQGTGRLNFTGAPLHGYVNPTHTAGQWAAAAVQCAQADTCVLWGQVQ